MAELNQIFISNVLGSTMKECRRSGFGQLGQLRATGALMDLQPADGEQLTFTQTTDRLIARAFADVSRYSPDRLLAEPSLAMKFAQRAQHLGVKAPPAAINHRLMWIRKNPRRAGVKLAAFAKADRVKDIQRIVFAAEMAMVPVSYRFGASVDDMLEDPEIGREFDQVARSILPERSVVDLRLAALYIRKQRHFAPTERHLIGNIPLGRLQKKWVTVGTIDRLRPEDVPSSEGVFLLSEVTNGEERDLYIGEDENLQEGVKPFRDLGIFQAVANHFWTPRPDRIRLRIAELDESFYGFSRRLWELKLLKERSPIFNMKVA